jgi:hypothetical protein
MSTNACTDLSVRPEAELRFQAALLGPHHTATLVNRAELLVDEDPESRAGGCRFGPCGES